MCCACILLACSCTHLCVLVHDNVFMHTHVQVHVCLHVHVCMQVRLCKCACECVRLNLFAQVITVVVSVNMFI